MKKQGIYTYAVVGNSKSRLSQGFPLRSSSYEGQVGGRVKIENIFLVNYQDLTLIGKMINIADFQKELQEALKDPKAMGVVLTEHQGFLDRLMKETTIVPFQFGTILKDKEGAVNHLKSSYVKYRELLKKFKEREEWGVRVFVDLKKLRTGIVQFNPETKEKRGSGTAYLLKKKQEEEAEKAIHGKLAFFSEEIFNNLKELTLDCKVTKSGQRFSEKGELLISVFAFLLPKSKVKKFNQKLAELGKKYREFGLRLISSGPWPAYNFVS